LKFVRGPINDLSFSPSHAEAAFARTTFGGPNPATLKHRVRHGIERHVASSTHQPRCWQRPRVRPSIEKSSMNVKSRRAILMARVS
jgi:hypothetical protein